MRHIALTSLLCALVACTGPEEELLNATLTIHYSFDGYVIPAEDCLEAWAQNMWVHLESDSELMDLALACDNVPLVIEELEPTDWTLTLRTAEDIETAEYGWNISEPMDITLESDGHEEVDVVLMCYEGGVEDRCAGE